MKNQIVVIALTLIPISAFAATSYPGDDWKLHKPGTNDKQSGAKDNQRLIDDYSKCIMSAAAPPTLDTRTNKQTTDPRLIEAYNRFILFCTGAKGYVLVPPDAKD
jgi:hypothetical protein